MYEKSGPRGWKSGLACGLALGGLCGGCSSSYEPARSPRASLVLDDGAPRVVRDGVDQGGFSFGGGVVDAVRGDPRAEQEARSGRKLVIGGFVVSLAGIGLETGGLVYSLSNPRNDSTEATGLGLVLAGVTTALTGMVIMMNGQPRLYDALNIYNDDLEARRAPPAPVGPVFGLPTTPPPAFAPPPVDPAPAPPPLPPAPPPPPGNAP